MKKFLLILTIASAALHTAALTTDSLKSRFEVNARAGYAFNSNHELMERLEDDPDPKTITHAAMSLHLQYSLSGLGDESTRSVYQGVGVGITSFLAPYSVGTPVSFYVLQGAPFATIGDNLSLEYEWNFGFASGWHRTESGFDLVSNLVLGSKTNAYINLGVKAAWTFAPGWSLTGGLDLSHYSNGNTSWPNPGVNTVGARVGLSYTLGQKAIEKVTTPFGKSPDFERSIVYDVMAYGAWRKCYFPYERAGFDSTGEIYLLSGHFGVAGLNFSPLWWFHPRFRAGLSADFQWAKCNGLIQDDYDYRFPDAWKQLTMGLSARFELVMPIFTVNIGIGYGLAGSRETRLLYQTINLKTYLVDGLYLNTGYRLNKFRNPSNLMLGIGYTFGHTKNKK